MTNKYVPAVLRAVYPQQTAGRVGRCLRSAVNWGVQRGLFVEVISVEARFIESKRLLREAVQGDVRERVRAADRRRARLRWALWDRRCLNGEERWEYSEDWCYWRREVNWRQMRESENRSCTSGTQHCIKRSYHPSTGAAREKGKRTGQADQHSIIQLRWLCNVNV